MNFTERITIAPDICHGKPCIRGLRYPVEFLLELLSSGMTHEEILALLQSPRFANRPVAAPLEVAKRIEYLRNEWDKE